jgi:hypothetical protein
VIDTNRAALGKSHVFKLASHLDLPIQTSQAPRGVRIVSIIDLSGSLSIFVTP